MTNPFVVCGYISKAHLLSSIKMWEALIAVSGLLYHVKINRELPALQFFLMYVFLAPVFVITGLS